MPVPNIPNMLVVPLLDTVTFNMIWEDIQCSGELSTLIITEREANATARSALFTCWGSSNIEPDNHILLRNSCLYTIYPTFSFPQIDHPTSPLTNSSPHRTDIKICPHSSLTPRSSERNPIPIINTSSCFTFLVLIRFALPPVLRSAGLHFSSSYVFLFRSRSCSTFATQHRPLLRFPFLHRTILYLFLPLVQRCGSLP